MKRVVILDDEDETGASLAMAPAVAGLHTTKRKLNAMESFPLLALSLILFAVLNLTSGESARPWFRAEAFTIHQMSGDLWHISGGDVFLSFSMFLLYIEILRSTRSGGESIINHAFSALVFVGALMLFLTRNGYGNSVFFMFMCMTALDFMAGFIITAVTARRDTTFGHM